MTHTSTEQSALTTAQECADYATSLRSAAMAVKLEGRAPPASFLRAAELFERAATELNLKLARVQELETTVETGKRLLEPVAPDFSHVATRKLQDLQERGYRVTGYAIEKPVEGGQPKRGFITAGGFVGWWRGDDEWRFGGAEKKQN